MFLLTLSGYDVVPVELIEAGDKVVAVAQAVGSGSTSQIAGPTVLVATFFEAPASGPLVIPADAPAGCEI